MKIQGAFGGGTNGNWRRALGKGAIIERVAQLAYEQWIENREQKQMSFHDCYVILEQEMNLFSKLCGIWHDIESYSYGYELTRQRLQVKTPKVVISFELK